MSSDKEMEVHLGPGRGVAEPFMWWVWTPFQDLGVDVSPKGKAPAPGPLRLAGETVRKSQLRGPGRAGSCRAK